MSDCTTNHARLVRLEISEFDRPIFWLARSEWNTLPETACHGQPITCCCAFASREEAIRWAKFEARGCIDWTTWKQDERGYPYDTNRDDERLTPTFIATWKEGPVGPGGQVSVTKMEVCGKFDWFAAGSMPPGIDEVKPATIGVGYGEPGEKP